MILWKEEDRTEKRCVQVTDTEMMTGRPPMLVSRQVTESKKRLVINHHRTTLHRGDTLLSIMGKYRHCTAS